jgi:hypothetical protein
MFHLWQSGWQQMGNVSESAASRFVRRVRSLYSTRALAPHFPLCADSADFAMLLAYTKLGYRPFLRRSYVTGTFVIEMHWTNWA